jgi:E3 ubiquitin-protein ligase RBBP6
LEASAVKKKKKKKPRVPGNGKSLCLIMIIYHQDIAASASNGLINGMFILLTAEEQWKNFQDFGTENFSGMPLGPTGAFNPYWGGGVPLPMDYMNAPFPGPMPYMGYPPGPFDPFGGGVLPQDPFMPPGYMMPGVPRYII